jgi:hypothetical protein
MSWYLKIPAVMSRPWVIELWISNPEAMLFPDSPGNAIILVVFRPIISRGGYDQF